MFSWKADYFRETAEMTFDDLKILSKKERHRRERDLRRVVNSFVGSRVNLALSDGSVIVNVRLESPAGKCLIRYRSTAAGALRYLQLFQVELITPVSPLVALQQEAS